MVEPDLTAPVISLNGPLEVWLNQGDSFTDTVLATDDVDGDLTSSIIVSGGPVDTSVLGSYSLTYNVSGKAGNAASPVTRTIFIVLDGGVPPELVSIKSITSEPDPAFIGGEFLVGDLIDGELPEDGWRSTWVVWQDADPEITVELEESNRLHKAVLYYQPYARDDDLVSIEVLTSDDGVTFTPFNTYNLSLIHI